MYLAYWKGEFIESKAESKDILLAQQPSNNNLYLTSTASSSSTAFTFLVPTLLHPILPLSLFPSFLSLFPFFLSLSLSRFLSSFLFLLTVEHAATPS